MNISLFPTTVIGSLPRPGCVGDLILDRKKGSVSTEQANEQLDHETMTAILWTKMKKRIKCNNPSHTAAKAMRAPLMLCGVFFLAATVVYADENDKTASASKQAAPSVAVAGKPAARSGGWRGDGSGRFAAADPPTTWDEKTNILWSATVGNSHSSPIVSNGRIFVTVEPDELVCLDAATGKELWRRRHGAGQLPKELKEKVVAQELGSGNAAQTPVADGKHVFAVFGDSVVACYDFAGERKWIRAFGVAAPDAHGRSASPVLADGKLLVHLGDLAALDAQTGKTLWKAEDTLESFGTSLVTSVGSERVVVTPAGEVVKLRDGEVLARGLSLVPFASPVVSEGVAYFIGADATAVKLPDKAKAFAAEPTWLEYLDGDFYASPVVHDGLIHTVNDGAIYYVIDAKTGKILLEKELPIRPAEGGDAIVYPSVSLAGGYLFIANDGGETVVLKPGKTYEQVAKNRLGSGAGGTPALAGKCIYLRSGKRVYCVAEKKIKGK